MEAFQQSGRNSLIERWCSYLSIEQETLATLQEFYWVMELHIDEVLGQLYTYLSTNPETAKFYQNEQSLLRAKSHQRAHLMGYLFRGDFGVDYYHATLRIGKTHHKLGIDFKLYSGAYCIVMQYLARAVNTTLIDCPEDADRYLSALNRVIFMDMGIATAVYYDTVSVELEELAYELNFALAKAGEMRDNETGEHIKRISRMSYALAQAIGQDSRWCKMIKIASPLHDVGKIGVPDDVLLKPGKLDEREWQKMSQHPAIGGEIIPDNQSELIRMARRIALTHHEKWDGTGYPAGLQGEEIPLEGRIVAICDVFDALLSVRPYKPAWSVEEAAGYLTQQRGQHFDPQLLDVFLQHIDQMLHIRSQFADVVDTEFVAD